MAADERERDRRALDHGPLDHGPLDRRALDQGAPAQRGPDPCSLARPESDGRELHRLDSDRRSPARPESERRELDPESGVATVFACLCICLLIGVTALGVHLGGAVLGRQRAEIAADLGALAGAMRVHQGADAACARAREVVTSNGGIMKSCRTDGLDVLLEVRTHLAAWGEDASARARAGPVRVG